MGGVSNTRTVKNGDSAWKVAERNLNPTGKQKVSGNAIVNEMKRLAKVNGCKDYNEFNKKFFSKVGGTYSVGNSSTVQNNNGATAAAAQNSKSPSAASSKKTGATTQTQSKSVTKSKTKNNTVSQNANNASRAGTFQPTYSKPYNPDALKDPKVHALFDQYNVPFKTRNQILQHVDEASRKYNLDPKMVLAFMQVESSFNPYAKGKGSSAYGLMQITRATGIDFCPNGDRTNMRNNIMGAANLLKKLDNKYGGNLNFMAQGYNQGYYSHISVNNQPAPGYARKVKNAYSNLA